MKEGVWVGDEKGRRRKWRERERRRKEKMITWVFFFPHSVWQGEQSEGEHCSSHTRQDLGVVCNRALWWSWRKGRTVAPKYVNGVCFVSLPSCALMALGNGALRNKRRMYASLFYRVLYRHWRDVHSPTTQNNNERYTNNKINERKQERMVLSSYELRIFYLVSSWTEIQGLHLH